MRRTDNPTRKPSNVSEGRAYVAFLKLLDLTARIGAEECHRLFQRLDDTVGAICKSGHAWSLPSPYGAAVVFDNPRSALVGVCRILNCLSKSGIRVGVGVDWGLLERVYNFNDWNTAAVAINTAARIASRPRTSRRLALTPTALEQVAFASSQLRSCFGSCSEGRVKTTRIAYHMAKEKPLRTALKAKPLIVHSRIRPADPRQADIIVYDIVRYSEMTPSMQKAAVAQLSDCVERSAKSVDSADWSYGPSGDGGYFALVSDGADSASRAWHFAVELRNQCRLLGIPVRIGLAHGPVLFRGAGGAVGGAVLLADEISSLAPSGGIAVSKVFWDAFHPSYKNGWKQKKCRLEAKALVVDDGQTLQPSEDLSRLMLFVAKTWYLQCLSLVGGNRITTAMRKLAGEHFAAWKNAVEIIERQYGRHIRASVILQSRRWLKDIEDKVKR
jgi:class 3 adenylate cyclase